MGVDGKQGPYLLSGSGGDDVTIIVAGSERVWLDGVRLRRGRDNDYTIDYAAGEIRFTERRPVTSDNEITVDYEYSLTDYDRDVYGGRGTLSMLGGRALLGAGFFRESDDVSSGTGSALSEEQRDILSAAGDDAGLARDDGIDYVSEGGGDYVLTEDGHFEYAGSGEGDYSLSFERVDSGDYDYDYALGHYVFAGQDSGDYDLGRELALPIDHVVAEVDGRLSLGSEGEAALQAALSSYDRNRFSDLDDDDNLGSAVALDAATPALSVGGDLLLDASVSARRVAGNFRGVSRYRNVDYQERWELTGLALPEQEELLEAGASVRGAAGGRVSLSYGRLDRGGVLDADRLSFSGDARPWGRLSLRTDGRIVALDHRPSSGERLSRERTYVRTGADYELGRLTPGVSYASDERTEDGAGSRYDEYGGSLAGSPWRGVSFRGSYSFRKTQTVDDGSREDESLIRTHAWRLALDRWSALTVDGSLVRRETDYESGAPGSDSSYDLVSLRLGHRSGGGGVAGEVRYTVTSTEIEIKERYVTEDDGVEVTRIVSTGVYEPVTDLEASTRWSFRYGGRGGRASGLPEPTPWRRFLSGLTLETDVRLEESTTTDEKGRLYALDPAILRSDDTVRGVLSGRHTLRYTRPGGGLSARLAVTTRSELNRAYANTEESRAERAATLDIKLSRRGGVTYRVQGDVGTRDQDSGTSDSYELHVRGILGEIRAARMGPVDGRVTASCTLEDDTLNSVDVTTTELTPSATLRFRGRGALTGSYSWIDVDGGGSDVPTYMAEGRRGGATSEWRLSGDYRVNTYLTTSLSYYGELRPGAEARHTLDLRVNAFF